MNMTRDIGYAMRLLGKTPGFTVLTVLVMACGIGLSVYLFSFMHTMLYKPFPFKDGDSLMRISVQINGEITRELSIHDAEEIKSQLKGVTEFNRFRRATVNVSGRDGTRKFNAYEVDQGFHHLTRIKPLLGRDFVAGDMHEGAPEVAIISEEAWMNYFAGRADVLEQKIRINGRLHDVIGVMPPGYQFPDTSDIWLPFRVNAASLPRGEGGHTVIAYHLMPGYSAEDINRQLSVIMARIEKQYPKTNTGVSARTHTIQISMGEGGQPVIYSLHIAAVLILILASINVGNLLLTRAIKRNKETAIRVALGAPRYRLMSQMLWESVIICLTGTFIGVMVLGWGLDVTSEVVGAFFLEGPPFWWEFGIDSYTLKLIALFFGFTIIITGVIPAWKNTSGDFNAVLRDGTRGALGKNAGRLNKILVISEIFLSITILILAGVFMVSAWKSAHGDYGANTDNMFRARIDLSEAKYDTPAKKNEFIQSVYHQLTQKTEFGKVVIASDLPSDFSRENNLEVKGREYIGTTNQSLPRVNNVVQSVNTLKDLQVELIAGRYLNATDEGADKTNVVVTESLARQFFEGESAIGQQIRFMYSESNYSAWLTVVGVVKHVVYSNQPHDNSAKVATVFRPFSQEPRNYAAIAFEMKTSEIQAAKSFRRLLQDIDVDIAPYEMESYADGLKRRVAPMSFISNVFLLFGIAALVLAASGIYGVMANTINQRTQEIGIKRALGAAEERITREFLMSGITQLIIGAIPAVVIGGGVGLAMAGAVGSGAIDVVIIALSITLILSIVVIAATIIPTRQALQFEPATTLHCE